MSYTNLLKPRREVLSDEGIDGIVDLANLSATKRKKLEARPQDFLDLTYPTAEIRRVISHLNNRFTTGRDTPALFLFEGLKGSGKSHLLVLIYHLLQSRKDAIAWLITHGLSLTCPSEAIIVVHKYTDRPLLRLWDFVFIQAGMSIRGSYEVYPSDKQILEALGDKHLVVVLDELETGIRMIQDPAVQRQNLGFLQMLSELGTRSPQVTIFASVYDVAQEPGATLIRVPNVRVQFARATAGDRARVVLHRIFGNYLQFDPAKANQIIESCLNTWCRFLPTFDAQGMRGRLAESFPFHPDLLTLVLERIPARGGFQNIRGSLGFLANLVRITHQSEDLITAGHARLSDRETAVRLQDLDPTGDLINRAKGNIEELAQQSPLSEAIGAATMLYTLTGDGRMRGATHEDLIRHVVLPGFDINDFEQGLLAFQKYASHFHVTEGRFYFDLEENADAKVEFRSLTIDPTKTKAKALLRAIWKGDIFRETESSVVWSAADETRAELDALSKNRLRFVLASRRLKPEERHDLYRGLAVRNQVLLLEPRAEDFCLDMNADLIKWAQRVLAASELKEQAGQAGNAERVAEYERIAREDRKAITEAIKRAGLTYIRYERFGGTSVDDAIETENVQGTSKEEALKFISQQLFPVGFFQDHLLGRLDQIKGKMVRDVDKDYREMLCFPVPTTVASVTKAIRELCRLRRIGIYHTSGNFSDADPNLTESELLESRIGDPFDPLPGQPRQLGTPPVMLSGTEPPSPVPPGPIPSGLVPPAPQTEQISIPFKPTAGALRQEVAAKLAGIPGVRVLSIQFQIYAPPKEVDLSSVASALRGSLSGQGTIDFEIKLAKRGDLSKAEVEQFCEQVPAYHGAQYAARLEIIKPQE